MVAKAKAGLTGKLVTLVTKLTAVTIGIIKIGNEVKHGKEKNRLVNLVTKSTTVTLVKKYS